MKISTKIHSFVFLLHSNLYAHTPIPLILTAARLGLSEIGAKPNALFGQTSLRAQVGELQVKC